MPSSVASALSLKQALAVQDLAFKNTTSFSRHHLYDKIQFCYEQFHQKAYSQARRICILQN